MKNTHNALNMLLNYIGRSESISESEKVRLLINTFFTKDDNREIPHANKLNITNIEINESDNEKIGITIELSEPGLLVGKEGKTIKQLGGFISKKLDKKARIYVKELNGIDNVQYA